MSLALIPRAQFICYEKVEKLQAFQRIALENKYLLRYFIWNPEESDQYYCRVKLKTSYHKLSTIRRLSEPNTTSEKVPPLSAFKLLKLQLMKRAVLFRTLGLRQNLTIQECVLESSSQHIWNSFFNRDFTQIIWRNGGVPETKNHPWIP